MGGTEEIKIPEIQSTFETMGATTIVFLRIVIQIGSTFLFMGVEP